jgi:hypothetical protein
MNTDDIIYDDDLCKIAGAGTRVSLIEWLQDNNVPFILARSGWPRVHRKALEHAMGVSVRPEAKIKGVEFNFDKIK